MRELQLNEMSQISGGASAGYYVSTVVNTAIDGGAVGGFIAAFMATSTLKSIAIGSGWGLAIGAGYAIAKLGANSAISAYFNSTPVVVSPIDTEISTGFGSTTVL